MDALEAIAGRYSTREFAETRVPKDVIERIVDAGRLAPTARNVQPWHFVVVTDAETRRRIAALADFGRFIARAPACVCVFCRDTKYYLEDGCAATQNMLIAATALGVQSCWVAGDKKLYCGEIADMLGVPPGHKLVAMVALGYEVNKRKPTPKRPLADVLHWERF